MLGLVGSLLGSVASGAMGLFGQSSANEANADMYGSRYQTSVKDMTKAGLNPAAMFGSGMAGVGSPPQMQSTMAAPAAAMKDAASSATQQLIAQKTIDQLTEQIAKTNAEKANIVAGTPGVAARSDIDVLKSGAIKGIPASVRTPLIQAGFGADTMRAAGLPAAIGGGAAASAKSVASGVKDAASGLSGPSYSSAKAAISELKRKYDSSPRYSDAEREAARLRNAKRWGWLTGDKARGSVQYQQ